MTFRLQAGGWDFPVHDEGSGPAMLFVHDWGSSSIVFRRMAARHFPRWRRISFDLPGHGTCRDGSSAPGPALVRSMIDRIVADLAPGPFVLVGQCMGSSLALDWAVYGGHPSCTGLILLEPVLRAPALLWLLRLPLLGPLALGCALGPALSPIVRAGGTTPDPATLRERRILRLHARESSALRCLDLLMRHGELDHHHAIAGLTLPVCLAWGRKSFAFVRRSSAVLRSLIPHARVVEATQLGHFDRSLVPALLHPALESLP